MCISDIPLGIPSHSRLTFRPHVPVLRGLNLEIKPGHYVALVGPSGCGKSTCISLIERFYDPRAGQIVVDGVPVSEYHLDEYRKCISLVSQEPTYSLLIRN
jgi:ATP-binding cassette, subfamily B (MDR/TAP), member 1